MNKSEVLDLMIEIKSNYPGFDVSEEEVDRHFKHLKDFPLPAAMKNVENHVKTSSWPPKIAEIRGYLGDQLDSLRSKEEADSYFAQIDLWRRNGNPPPVGYWDGMRAKLRGAADVSK